MQFGIGPKDVAEHHRGGPLIDADLHDAPRPGRVAPQQVGFRAGVHRPGRDEPGGQRHGAQLGLVLDRVGRS